MVRAAGQRREGARKRKKDEKVKREAREEHRRRSRSACLTGRRGHSAGQTVRGERVSSPVGNVRLCLGEMEDQGEDAGLAGGKA